MSPDHQFLFPSKLSKGQGSLIFETDIILNVESYFRFLNFPLECEGELNNIFIEKLMDVYEEIHINN